MAEPCRLQYLSFRRWQRMLEARKEDAGVPRTTHIARTISCSDIVNEYMQSWTLNSFIK
jgi:hypothetical protein